MPILFTLSVRLEYRHRFGGLYVTIWQFFCDRMICLDNGHYAKVPACCLGLAIGILGQADNKDKIKIQVDNNSSWLTSLANLYSKHWRGFLPYRNRAIELFVKAS